jgi:hypothetical protein
MGQQVIGLMYGVKATKSFEALDQDDDDEVFGRPGWKWTEDGEAGFMVASAMPEGDEGGLGGALLARLAVCPQAKRAQKRWEKFAAYMAKKHPGVKLGKPELRFVFHEVA